MFLALPPLAPMTATLLFWAFEVENCLAMLAMGRWNRDIILNSFRNLLRPLSRKKEK